MLIIISFIYLILFLYLKVLLPLPGPSYYFSLEFPFLGTPAFLIISEIAAIIILILTFALHCKKKTKVWKIWGLILIFGLTIINIGYPFIKYQSEINHDRRFQKVNEENLLSFSLYGDIYQVPFQIKDLLDNGWKYESFSENDIFEPKEAILIQIGVCDGVAVNQTDKAISLEEMEVVMIHFPQKFWGELQNDGYKRNDFILAGGIIPESRKLHVENKYKKLKDYMDESSAVNGNSRISIDNIEYLTIRYSNNSPFSPDIKLCFLNATRLYELTSGYIPSYKFIRE